MSYSLGEDVSNYNPHENTKPDTFAIMRNTKYFIYFKEIGLKFTRGLTMNLKIGILGVDYQILTIPTMLKILMVFSNCA